MRWCLALVLVLLAGCSSSPALPDDASSATRATVQVLGSMPHDPAAFTQGFELAGPSLWEGTGLVGQSQLRETDPTTGAVRRAVDLPADQFGEGITVTPTAIWQLTWKNGVVYERDPATLAVRRTVGLDREGWGICHTGGVPGVELRSAASPGDLVTSDGSTQLVVRDPATFAPRRTLETGVSQLNELECVGSTVWANVWRTDEIVGVDLATGQVTTVVDASALRPAQTRSDPDAVLNGIAAIPGTASPDGRAEFLLTGKRWPTTFRVALRAP